MFDGTCPLVILEVVVLGIRGTWWFISGTPWEAAPSWPWKALRRDLYTNVPPREEYMGEFTRANRSSSRAFRHLLRGPRSSGRQFYKELWAPQQLGEMKFSRTQVGWRRASATPDLKDYFYGVLMCV